MINGSFPVNDIIVAELRLIQESKRFFLTKKIIQGFLIYETIHFVLHSKYST